MNAEDITHYDRLLVALACALAPQWGASCGRVAYTIVARFACGREGRRAS